MKSILKELYAGSLAPMENTFPNDPEYQTLWQFAEAEEQYFEEILSPEARTHFSQYQSYLRRVYNLEICTGFTRGFRLGMSLLWEVVNGEG